MATVNDFTPAMLAPRWALALALAFARGGAHDAYDLGKAPSAPSAPLATPPADVFVDTSPSSIGPAFDGLGGGGNPSVALAGSLPLLGVSADLSVSNGALRAGFGSSGELTTIADLWSNQTFVVQNDLFSIVVAFQRRSLRRAWRLPVPSSKATVLSPHMLARVESK